MKKQAIRPGVATIRSAWMRILLIVSRNRSKILCALLSLPHHVSFLRQSSIIYVNEAEGWRAGKGRMGYPPRQSLSAGRTAFVSTLAQLFRGGTASSHLLIKHIQSHTITATRQKRACAHSHHYLLGVVIAAQCVWINSCYHCNWGHIVLLMPVAASKFNGTSLFNPPSDLIFKTCP